MLSRLNQGLDGCGHRKDMGDVKSFLDLSGAASLAWVDYNIIS